MKETGDEKGKFLFFFFFFFFFFRHLVPKKRPYARELEHARLKDGIMTLEISIPALLFPA